MKHSATLHPTGHIVVKCGHCGSEGYATQTQARRVSDKKNDQAQAKHEGDINQLYQRYMGLEGEIMTRAKREGRDPAAELKELGEKVKADHQRLIDAAPPDTATHTIDNCPWCGEEIKAPVKKAA